MTTDKKKSVLLRAPAMTNSGYGVHSRQIFKYLKSREDFDVNVQLLPWGNTQWHINHKFCGGLIGEIMNCSNVKNTPYDVTFQLQLPHEWDTKLGRYNIGITAGVETDRCHPDWINAINKMDLVIVPSQHTKRTFENSGAVQKKIIVIPEAYVESINEDVKPLDLELETDFNFLVFGQITGDRDTTDRKNTYKTLKWICETFRKDEDVGVIIKTNCGRNTTVDRRKTTDLLRQHIGRFRKGDFPRFYLVHGDMSDEEVAGLYKHPKVKALVALTRGEGFGLPILEAAASDLPVIATNWSGHLDYMNKGKFIKVEHDLREVDVARIDGNVFVQGAKWAEAREGSSKKALKKFREGSEIPEQWARELGEVIRKEYSMDSISNLYAGLMAEVEAWWS